MIAIGVLAALPASAIGSPISGGGSGFAALELDQWRADTARAPYSLQVNYVSQGSTFGRQQFIDGNLDFGVSDVIFQAPELTQLASKRCGGRSLGDCFVYVPVSAGGLAFMYNLVSSSGQRISNLQLTRRAACKIFTGAIKKWNDPEIVATNPQLGGLSDDILPIIRSDGAGESFVFSQFCIAVAPDVWQAFIADRVANDPANVAGDFRAGQPVSNWPQNWGRANAIPYADGVANNVADPTAGKDAITYTANGYAKVRSFPVASVQNAAGVFTQPTEENVTVALAYASGRGDGTFDLHFDGADPRAYFPSTYSYVIAQTGGFDAGKGAALAQFLCYAVSKGQVIAPPLGYARLSSVLVGISINAISRIPGAPPSGQCFVAGAPPPPPPASVAGGTAAPGAAAGGKTGAGTTVTGPGGAAGAGPNGVNCDSTGTSTTTAAGTSTSVAAGTPTSTSAPTSTTSAPTSTTRPSAVGTTGTTQSSAATTTSTTEPCTTASGQGSGTGAGSLDAELAAEAGAAQHRSGWSDGHAIFILLVGAAISAGLSAVRKVRGSDV